MTSCAVGMTMGKIIRKSGDFKHGFASICDDVYSSYVYSIHVHVMCMMHDLDSSSIDDQIISHCLPSRDYACATSL